MIEVQLENLHTTGVESTKSFYKFSIKHKDGVSEMLFKN